MIQIRVLQPRFKLSKALVTTSDNEDQCGKKPIILVEIILEHYYADAYKKNWYIGRIVNISDEKCKFKFLKDNLETYKYSQNDDIQKVQK